MKATLLDLSRNHAVASLAWEPPGRTSDRVLLLHGAESHAMWFDEVGSALAERGITAIAYDRTGWGQSAGRRGALASSKDALAELAEVAHKLGAPDRRLHLAGLSWGGLLAAAAVNRFGRLFASVTLIAPAVFRLRSPKAGELLRAAAGFCPSVSLPITPEDFTAKPERLAFVRQDQLRVEAVNLGFCLATVRLEGLARRRALLDADAPPMQVLLAERDALIDTAATERWARARAATVHTLPGTMHSLVLEDPAAVARLLAAFIQTTNPEAATVHAG